MLRRLSALAALALCCSVSTVHALGLGEIRVKSGLSQRFSAVIPFVSLSSSEAENVRARLARVGQYSDAGIERADYLSSLEVEVITDDGNPRVEIRSREIAREPLLNVMLEVRTPGGPKVLRNYPVFLDPPVVEPTPAPAVATASEDYYEVPAAPEPAPAQAITPPAAAPAPAEVPVDEPVVVAQPEAEPIEVESEALVDAPADGGEVVTLEPGTHGPVEPGEALWEIANFNAPDGVSQQQAMLAIFEANPNAFADQNINYLKTGVVLDIPDAATMERVSQAGAIARLAELNKPLVESQLALAEGAEADSGLDTASSEFTLGDADGLAEESMADPVESLPSSEADSSIESEPEAPPSGDVGSEFADATDPAADLAASPVAGDEVSGAADETLATDSVTGAVDSGADTLSAAQDGTASELSDAEAVSDAELNQEAESAAEVSRPYPSATEGYEAASDSAPTEALPPASSGQDAGGSKLLDRLWVGLLAIGALILGIFGLRKFRDARDAKAQREYEEAMAQMQASGGSPAAAAAAEAVKKDRAAFAPQDEDEDATRLEDEDATRLEQEEDITAPHPPAGTDDVAETIRQGTTDVELGDNDPVAEADFHLAYGLYDEAALMLQQASEREPDRSDIRVKLAETYFAAGNATQFESVAEPLKAELDAEEWGKIAIMGRQLCPGVSLFAEDGSADAGGDVGVDLNLDEPLGASDDAGGDGLEFSLEELELPDDTATATDEADKDSGLEFDLGDFDLEGSQADEKATALPDAGEVKPKDFDLAGSELETGSEDNVLDVKLDEIDSDLLDDENTEEAADEDDPGTKLDLARAYVEMGDAQMAGGLLDEVEASGDDGQKAEAAKLRQRLSELGD